MVIPVAALTLLAFTTGCAPEASAPGPDEQDGAGLPAAADGEGVPGPDGFNPEPAADAVIDPTPTTGLTSPSEEDGPPSTTVSTLADADWSLNPGQASAVLELMETVESLRGREFLARPPVVTASESEGPVSTTAPGWISPDRLAGHLQLLEFLGMFSGDIEPGEILNYPLREPFYDFERRTIVLPAGADPLDGYQKWVLVGELVHALAAQHDPAALPRLSAGGDDPDRMAARTALVEGEAALIQTLYLDSLAPERRLEVARLGIERPRIPIDSLPAMLGELLMFPYRAGALLAVDLYRLGGTEALDDAFDHPPRTTEHVLHMDKYRRLEPAVMIPPWNLNADGYIPVEDGAWGEHRWLALLNHHSGPAQAARAAEGWGGDRYELLVHPITGDLVFVARYVGDSFADESEMNSAIRTMLSSGLESRPSEVVDTITEWEGGAGYALLSWDLDGLTMVIASDPAAGRMVAAQLGFAG